MRAFEYMAPTSVKEAVTLLAEKGDLARVLAGGTDILVMLRGGRRDAERLVDVKAIPELNLLAYDSRRGLTLGAAVPCHRIYEDKPLAKVYPGLIDAASLIGGIQIQGRASVGGNLCNSSPSADTVPALIALKATAVIAGPNGNREVPVEKFCTAPGRNVLGKGELLVSLNFPTPQRHSGSCYLRFIPRNEMDIAVVGVGVAVVLDDRGETFKEARIALAAVAPTPLFVEESGALLKGQKVTEEAVQRAAEAAQKAARPISDMRGTVEQRRHLVGVMTRRALHTAIQRAKEAN